MSALLFVRTGCSKVAGRYKKGTLYGEVLLDYLDQCSRRAKL